MADTAKRLSNAPAPPRGAAAPGTAKRLTSALQRVPVWLVYAVGFIPAVAYFALGVMDELGADPMKVLERELGEWALIFLIAGLCVTPLRQLLGLSLLRFRRALGLLAFWYVTLHLVTYLVLDQGLDWAAIWADIVKRPYITIGMASFVLLVPLALTSNNASIRRLGAQAWNRLHTLVYLAAAGGALHYLLVVKSWPLEPLIYAAIIATLLAWRGWRRIAKPAGARAARA
ncbi:MAG TPA: protein-methionine-sulfoxide reductase heme-binding subunit MsrQ [Microvirga sp.]|jgi:sulfoxide reductase heme-binding subunit YedZ|nr:protein-methionine-sulfoxide reductase heme-binding subunit MsrQ [Microvirga sp.]